MGAGIVEGIIAARDEGGPFASIEDFCQRVSFRQLNKRALECMIKAGALDGLGDRGTLLANLDRLMNLAQSAQKLRESGQATLFDIFQEARPARALALQPRRRCPEPSSSPGRRSCWASTCRSTPSRGRRPPWGRRVTAMCSEVSEEMDGREVIIAGIVTHIRQILTRAGRPFLAVEMEDLSGSVEVTVWPDVYDQTRDLWVEGNILLLNGARPHPQRPPPGERAEGRPPTRKGANLTRSPTAANAPAEAPRPVRASRSPAPRARTTGPARCASPSARRRTPRAITSACER